MAVNDLIMLIHGTWGDQNCFTDKTVEFIRNNIWLKSNVYRADCHPLRNNNFCRRARAEKVVAPVLRQWKLDHPDGKLIVVGFSHGGNVALLLNRYLDRDYWPDLIITLGMPMLGVNDDDYNTITSFSYWLNIISPDDGVQPFASFLRKKGSERIDDHCNETIQVNYLEHHDLPNSMQVWNKIQEFVNKNERFQ